MESMYTKENVIDQATRIARNLTTGYESKKHGGYDIYDDDKIYIKYDTYYPNLSVQIKDENNTVVLSSSEYRVGQLHYGKWVDYLYTFIDKIDKVIEQKKIEDEEKQQKLHESKYSDIDDSGLFK